MTLLVDVIADFSQSKPDEPALIGIGDSTVSWSNLKINIDIWATELANYKGRVVALYLDNSPRWIEIDLACQIAGVISLPIPSFFSEQQVKHALKEAGALSIIHVAADRIATLCDAEKGDVLVDDIVVSSTHLDKVVLPNGTSKITFTSGTTGQPKGVCLSTTHQLQVADSLVAEIDVASPRHLAVLPFSTLLENIAGIYAPLLSGGSIIALPLNELGFNGSSQFNAEQFVKTIEHYQPNSLILLPELLMVLMAQLQQGWQLPTSIKFIAVGGSKVSVNLLAKAESLGLPVFEGYGLSECASVVALNSIHHRRIGSVGKPLPHVSVDCQSNEIIVQKNAHLGYVSQPESWYSEDVKTGDLGYIDSEGYLVINGRKKNTLISSYGRNINPEWLESELLATGLFSQAVVFGDAKPYCVSLLSPRVSTLSDSDIDKAIGFINEQLPDYARIQRWQIIKQAMTANDGLYTANGRPIRNAIYQHFQTQIEQLYEE